MTPASVRHTVCTMTRLRWLAPLLLLACSRGPGKPTDAPVTVCTKVGQSCEFAPGKLGLCIELEKNGKPALACQSQH